MFSSWTAQLSISMDKQPAVQFHNVGQVYFPQTRVECHYSLSPDHQWSSSDWIGIFQVGCSVKQYQTYVWALVPEGYTGGTSVNCCVIFHAFYLPQPSAVEYEFRYVNKTGEVCSCSGPFTFCAPKPLEELEILKKEEDEEDGEEELLLVIPRAQLLQSRLEDCLKKQEVMQQALDVMKKGMEKEKENNQRAKKEWEQEREAMREVISELRDSTREKYEMLKKMEGKHKDVKYSHENLTSELSKLMAERAECQQRIRDLEELNIALNDREKEGNIELERLKERLKKLSSQMKHDEEKRKTLQDENKAALLEVRGLQGRLEASERVAESLRRELRELSTYQGCIHTELQQTRLQVAQLTLQLSEENLLLREERANWALEREAYRHAAENDKKKLQELSCEVQRKEAWLQEERTEREKLEAELESEQECNRVLLSDGRRELQELKARLREEREEQQEGKQVFLLQAAPGPSSEDNKDTVSASAGSIGTHLFPSIHPERRDTPQSSSGTHTGNKADTLTSDTQGVRTQGVRPHVFRPKDCSDRNSELADSPMW